MTIAILIFNEIIKLIILSLKFIKVEKIVVLFVRRILKFFEILKRFEFQEIEISYIMIDLYLGISCIKVAFLNIFVLVVVEGE